MTTTLLDITSRLVLVILSIGVLLAFWRLARGPTVADRIVALDMIGLQAIGMLITLAAANRSEYLIDVAIVIAVLMFLSTIAMAHYVLRR